MTANHFYPSAQKGTELDQALRSSLIDSLSWCLTQAGVGGTPEVAIPDGWAPSPADYSRYYDLVQVLMNTTMPGSSSATDRIDTLIRELSVSWQQAASVEEGPDLTPKVTTLDLSHYSGNELDRIVRWLDLEPDNAMNLTALDEPLLAAGRATLTQALTALGDLAPDFHGEFTATVHEIILARPGGEQKLTFRGVSSFALWGALALNVDQHPHWRSYLPSLVHEYSHNVLFAMARHGPLVENPSDQLYYSPLRNEERPMDGIYHAAFVSAREAIAMNQALQRLAEGDLPQHYLEQEAYFRQVRDASSISCRDCVDVLDAEARLTDLGSTILEDTKSAMRENGLWQ